MTSRAIRIVIADDHALFRAGLRKLLEAAPDFAVVGEAEDGEQAIRLVKDFEPDILLLDFSMPGRTAVAILQELFVAPIKTRVVVLTASIEPEEMTRVIELGAVGVLMKTVTTELLYKCVRSVADGQYWIGRDLVTSLLSALAQSRGAAARAARPYGLTTREKEIAVLIGESYSNKDIADKLNITEGTVKRHLSQVFDKTGTSSRVELALFVHNHHIESD
jgi:two-component system nitrate/nitrite response regulator NarL